MYRLTNPEDAARLQEFAARENPTDLEGELHLARQMLEKAANAGQGGTVIALMNTIQKLAVASEAAKYRRGDLLAKNAVLNLAGRMVDILAANIAGRFAGWEEALDRVREDILTITVETQNPENDRNSCQGRPAPGSTSIDEQTDDLTEDQHDTD